MDLCAPIVKRLHRTDKWIEWWPTSLCPENTMPCHCDRHEFISHCEKNWFFFHVFLSHFRRIWCDQRRIVVWKCGKKATIRATNPYGSQICATIEWIIIITTINGYKCATIFVFAHIIVFRVWDCQFDLIQIFVYKIIHLRRCKSFLTHTHTSARERAQQKPIDFHELKDLLGHKKAVTSTAAVASR